MEASKKVIILNNIKSKQISQAIFILNDGEVDEFSAVREAEDIVSAYLDGKPLCRRRRRPLLLLLFLGCVLFSAAVFFFLR